MKPTRLTAWIVEIIVALFVLLFLYTAIMKLKDVRYFEGSMLHNPLIAGQAKLLSWSVPSIELIITAMLIIPKTRYAGLIAAALLMTIFTVYVVYMLATATKLPCTCGGILTEMTWRQHLVFNGTFVVLGLTAITIKTKKFIMINRRSRLPV